MSVLFSCPTVIVAMGLPSSWREMACARAAGQAPAGLVCRLVWPGSRTGRARGARTGPGTCKGIPDRCPGLRPGPRQHHARRTVCRDELPATITTVRLGVNVPGAERLRRFGLNPGMGRLFVREVKSEPTRL